VTALAFERNPFAQRREQERAFDYIREHFERFGLVAEVDPFEVGGDRFFNLLGTRRASSSDDWVIVTAHVDAVPDSPGADDNASGIAALLECARMLSSFEPDCTLCFAATDLEEYGIQGAQHLATCLYREGVRVRAMISLEMLAYTSDVAGAQRYPAFLRHFYPDRADFIALVGNRKSHRLLKQAAEIFRNVPGLPVETLKVPLNGWPVSATRLSDHAPFWDLGYEALMVTDTAFFRNPHYHQPTDTPDTLNYEFLSKVTEAVARTLADLADARPLKPLLI
jgi:Zn-dependent M28 family amino/carboxypeptidase